MQLYIQMNILTHHTTDSNKHKTYNVKHRPYEAVHPLEHILNPKKGHISGGIVQTS